LCGKCNQANGLTDIVSTEIELRPNAFAALNASSRAHGRRRSNAAVEVREGGAKADFVWLLR